MNEPTTVKLLLVFVRETTTTTKKVGRAFYLVSREEYEQKQDVDFDKRETVVYTAKGLRGSPGQIYEVEASDERGSQIFFGTMRYLGTWHDDKQRLAWAAQNRAFCNERDAKKREKTEGGDPLAEALSPIREQYQQCPYPQKQALLAAILYQITR